MSRGLFLGKGSSGVAHRFSVFLFVLSMGFSGAASAILVDRGPNMVYDTVLDITWVRDARLCVTLNNCINPSNSFVSSGMSWVDANTWAANLVYQGFDDWRLPYASVAVGSGPTSAVVNCATATEAACRDNEMGYMYYHNLGGTFGQNHTGSETAVGGEQLAFIQDFHWSGTQRSNPLTAWVFDFFDGDQGGEFKNSPLGAWAVRRGDVIAAAVPEPASGLLFGVGMLALAWASRAWRRH